MNKFSQFSVLALALVAIVNNVDSKAPNLQSMKRNYHRNQFEVCSSATGLPVDQLQEAISRNQECLLDCITKTGLLIPVVTNELEVCYPVGELRCVMGHCVTREEAEKTADKRANYVSVAIKVLSATVPDMDGGPTIGDSDVFVVVSNADANHPLIGDNQVLCHTPVIQDTNQPQWWKLAHACRPIPLAKDGSIKFEVYDSDKPRNVDFIGAVEVEVGTLLSKGQTNMMLRDKSGKKIPGARIRIEAKPRV